MKYISNIIYKWQAKRFTDLLGDIREDPNYAVELWGLEKVWLAKAKVGNGYYFVSSPRTGFERLDLRYTIDSETLMFASEASAWESCLAMRKIKNRERFTVHYVGTPRK